MFSNKLWPVLLALLALLAACGGGSAPASSTSPATPGNVLAVSVDAGPAGSSVNQLYTTVTVCRAGSASACQTIDHVLVDTGSTGLRLLSGVLSNALQLAPRSAAGGYPLLSCAQFVDNTLAWGPVVSADLQLGDKTAANVPIQIIGDPAFDALAPACGFGSAMRSAAELGANGILGLGLFPQDCGANCTLSAGNGFYYTCADARCAAAVGTTVSRANQLQNPVALFASDNNGVLIDLPAVAAGGAVRLNGALVFGIGTQSNNQPGSATALTTDSSGYIATLVSGRSLSTSFIDSGSNGLYFYSRTLPTCPGAASNYYCPGVLSSLAATLTGANAVQTTLSFPVANALALFADSSLAVLPGLSGTSGDQRSFDWGLPFFYGRRVFTGIEGKTSSLGAGPLYAF
jgi:hypothetical protein